MDKKDPKELAALITSKMKEASKGKDGDKFVDMAKELKDSKSDEEYAKVLKNFIKVCMSE